ncbi:MAG: flagellar filament capping protein FliD, partial [Eubacterium sp.]|nr:flagellar filament capping protein FliD [Eubacterium sp.]
STGSENDFTLTAVQRDENGNDTDYSAVLTALGINENDAKCARVHAQDAEIEWNGATFTGSTNTFTINGYTITASGVTDEELTVTTETDYEGIYDMIKDFLSEYNDIINDVYTKYNADSARKYNMLSEDEKEAMSDDEVEKWENTIKNSLLRKDNTLYSIMNTLNSTMSAGYTSNGETKYLFSFGLEKLDYFKAEENERYAFHINGDPDDEDTNAEENDLKAAIASDPEGTVEFFVNLSKTLYDNLTEAMGRSEYSSIYTIYDDKTMEKELSSYETKIKEAQKKLEDYEDKWFDKFSAMEVALSKLQSNSNSLSSLLGS